MNTFHVKRGDTVRVISGKDKGKTGKIIRVFTKTERVLVDGVNLFKKHVRPKTQQEKGQIIEIPRPLHHSNVKKIEDAK